MGVRLIRFLLVSLSVILIIIGSVIALMPTILSTEWGNRKFVEIVNERIPGHVNIKHFQVGWLSGQSVEGFELRNELDHLVVGFDEFVSNDTLTTILMQKTLRGNFKFNGLQTAFMLEKPIAINEVNIEGLISSEAEIVTLKMSGNTQQGGQSGHFDLDANLFGFDNNKVILAKNSSAKIKATVDQFPVDLMDLIFSQSKGTFRDAIGEFIDVRVDDTIIDDRSFQEMTISSQNLTARFLGTVQEGVVTLKDESTLQWSITSPLLDRINQNLEDFKVAHPTSLKIDIDTLQLPLQKVFDPKKFIASLSLQLSNTELKVKKPTRMINVGEIEATAKTLDSQEGERALSITIEGGIIGKHILVVDIPNSYDQFRKTFIEHIDFRSEVDHFPTQVMGNEFVELFGPTADIQASGIINDGRGDMHLRFHSDKMHIDDFHVEIEPNRSNGYEGTFTAEIAETHGRLNGDFDLNHIIDRKPFEATVKFNLDGDDYHAFADLQIKDKISLKKKPAELFIKMTPERFKLLQKLFHADLILDHPATIDVHLNTLNIPFKGDELAMIHSAFEGEVKIDRLDVNNPHRQQDLELESVVTKVITDNLSTRVTFSFNANRSHSADKLYIDGVIDDLFTYDGYLNLSDLSAKVDSKISDVPLNLIGQLFYLDPSLIRKGEASFGDKLSAEVHVDLNQMEGDVYGNLRGNKGQVTLDGHVRQGILALHKPFNAEFYASKDFGKYVLADTLPLLEGMIDSEQPLKVIIKPENFSFPITEMDYLRINIGSAMLDLGKVRFTDQAQLSQIIKKLTPGIPSEVPIWFTPIYFSIRNGEIQVDRFDMLVMNNYPIAAWGTINLPRDKVNMKVGISARALLLSQNISVADNGMLIIPLKGRTDNARVDVGKLTTQLISLKAKSEGSIGGLVMGSVIDLVTGGSGKIPQSTTDPLPWQNELEKLPAQERTKNRKTILPQEASKILDIFRR